MPTRRFKLTKNTKGLVNREKLAATTEADIQAFIAEYEKEADADARAYAKRKKARVAAARRMKRDAQGRFVSSKDVPQKRLTA